MRSSQQESLCDFYIYDYAVFDSISMPGPSSVKNNMPELFFNIDSFCYILIISLATGILKRYKPEWLTLWKQNFSSQVSKLFFCHT